MSSFGTILFQLEFSPQILLKILKVKFHDSWSTGAELYCADGQTDMTKIILTF